MNLTIIATVISAAAGFAVAWNLQTHQITKQELSHANERIAIARANRAAAERAATAVIVAQNNAASRAVVIRRQSVATGNAGNGLRLSSTAAVRTVEADPATCNSIIAAYDSVVAASTDFVQRVSTDADQCHSDLQLITDSWPKE